MPESAALSYEVTLPLTDLAPTRARHLARDVLATWQLAAQADTVGVVVTELISNAMQHGQPNDSLVLQMNFEDRCIRISVSDGSALRPIAQQVEADQTSGRGMHIVEQLTDRWGTDASPGGGKRVWVELRVADVDESL
ncbi:MAG: ATP-binding protein [Mycobacteriales bacterium]